LADTGYGVILPVALGAAIVFAAVVLLVKRLRRRAAASRVE
jgi:4-amino-4-deoxy-L-arabinose transferase-like glycosyltransferase